MLVEGGLRFDPTRKGSTSLRNLGLDLDATSSFAPICRETATKHGQIIDTLCYQGILRVRHCAGGQAVHCDYT